MSGPVSRLSPVVARVLAPNPGPMTLTGTNTWVVGDPVLGPPFVVDPGPLDVGHLDTVLRTAGGRIASVLLTHRHLDHGEGAAELARRAGCDVKAVDPTWRVGSAAELADEVVLVAAGVRLEVVATPGHTSDSVCVLVTGAGAPVMLTGDTVLGAGTSVITHPDGNLAAYLDSLRRLSDLVQRRRVARILPGHGPVVDDPAGVIHDYELHRRDRLDQVRAAVAESATTPAEVVARVYPDLVGTPLAAAAEQSVRAQLDYLAGVGLI